MANTPYAQQREARQRNTADLLHDLWYNAPLSRAMLAQRNGLTKSTVSAICNDLMALGLVSRVGKDRFGLGRPGVLLELDASARCAIGVEISTNYTAVVLTDMCCGALWQGVIPIEAGCDAETILGQTEGLIARAIEEARGRDALGALLGVGVGVPGAVDPGRESLVTSPSLGWQGLALKARLRTRFGLPIFVDNRARAAAIIEALNGSARSANSFVYVNLGTDPRASIEAAVVTKGATYNGAHGLAVDAGHMILDPNGPLCVCGQRGCWQALTNVEREVEMIRARLAAGEASVLQHHDGPLDQRAVHQAALKGDPLALEVFEAVNANHALGIANLVRLFDPELVVIGWASLALPESYVARMQTLSQIPGINVMTLIPNYLARRGVPSPEIVYAAHLLDACVLGAAALVVDNFLRNPPIDEVE